MENVFFFLISKGDYVLTERRKKENQTKLDPGSPCLNTNETKTHPSHRTIGTLNIRAVPTHCTVASYYRLDCHDCGTMEAEVLWLSEVKISKSEAKEKTTVCQKKMHGQNHFIHGFMIY